LVDKSDLTAQDHYGYTPLILALLYRNRQAYEQISSRTKPTDDLTRIFVAAAFGHGGTITKLLTSRSYLLNARLANGWTPLHMAAEWGSVPAIAVLLRAGADTSITDDQGNNVANWCLSHPGADAVIRACNVTIPALHEPPSQNDAAIFTPASSHLPIGLSSMTALINETHFAHPNDAIAAIKSLLDGGTDVNAHDGYGWTPLIYASQGFDEYAPQVVQMLIDHHADVNEKATDGTTALHHAFRPDVAKLLIDAGAKLDAQDSAGNTPLHDAAHSLQSGVVYALLAAGANANIRNDNGDTPLTSEPYIAERSQSLLAASDLTYSGCMGMAPIQFMLVNAIVPPRKTADEAPVKLDDFTNLLISVSRDDTASVRSALQRKPYLASQRLADGSTPLHVAALWHAANSMRILCSYGADVNARNDEADTPLISALMRRSEITADLAPVRFLLDHGADVNVTDRKGGTALEFATWDQNANLLSLLLAHKGNVNATDVLGKTILDTAEKADIIAVLEKAGAKHGDSAGAAEDDEGSDFTIQDLDELSVKHTQEEF
jgi:ankyrin repeat protein